MTNRGFVVDSRKINALFNELSFNKGEAKQALKGGLRKSAQIIQKQARLNLQSVRNRASGTTLNSKNLMQFVKITVYRNAKGVRIDIMDDKRASTNKRLQKSGIENKSFILKFFALGTDARYTKSHKRTGYSRRTAKRIGRGGYRGIIGESQFFRLAVEAKKEDAENMLEKAIIEQIKRVVKRRK